MDITVEPEIYCPVIDDNCIYVDRLNSYNDHICYNKLNN